MERYVTNASGCRLGLDGERWSGAWFVERYIRSKPVASISAPRSLAEFSAVGGGRSVGKAGRLPCIMLEETEHSCLKK